MSRPRVKDHQTKRAEAFDPAELCRRLESILQNDRQPRSYRRQRAVNHSYSTSYQHIPRVAAKDFSVTTAQDNLKKRDIHKLSRIVVLSYKLGNRVATSERNGIRALHRRASSNPSVSVLAERNQFQRSRAFEAAAFRDRARTTMNVGPMCNIKQTSRNSCQEVHALNYEESDEVQTATLEANFSRLEVKPFLGQNDRHDWTQRDECSDRQQRRFRFSIAPFVRYPSKRRKDGAQLDHILEEDNKRL